MNRDELRAADPQFAALADMARANGAEIRVPHYRFNDGRELGRIEADPPNTVWLDITKGSVMETQRDMLKGKAK